MRSDYPFDDHEGDPPDGDPSEGDDRVPSEDDDHDSAEEGFIDDEASYVCQACGEDIVIPIDVLAGSQQEYVEDCPVCCRPHVLTVRIEPDGQLVVDVRPE